MPIIRNVNVRDRRTSDEVAYAAQASYDAIHATITLVDGVVIHTPLVPNVIYAIDGKRIGNPVEGRYTGANGADQPVFLL